MHQIHESNTIVVYIYLPLATGLQKNITKAVICDNSISSSTQSKYCGWIVGFTRRYAEKVADYQVYPKHVGYNIIVMRQSVCLVVNLITVKTLLPSLIARQSVVNQTQ